MAKIAAQSPNVTHMEVTLEHNLDIQSSLFDVLVTQVDKLEYLKMSYHRFEEFSYFLAFQVERAKANQKVDFITISE